MNYSVKQPIVFDTTMEHPEEDETQTIASLDKTMGGIRETTFAHSGHAIRSVHAKSHGIVHATLTVADGLPSTLAQGLFSKGGRYDVLMRFSTMPGDVLTDSVSTPRGVAIKVIGVDGTAWPGARRT